MLPIVEYVVTEQYEEVIDGHRKTYRQFSECGKRAFISRMRSILYCFTEL